LLQQDLFLHSIPHAHLPGGKSNGDLIQAETSVKFFWLSEQGALKAVSLKIGVALAYFWNSGVYNV
jgi:hypothetical protein